MKKRTISRLLAAFLSVMLVMQSFCLTAFAAEDTAATTVQIPKGSTEAQVNQILTKALLAEDADTAAWEYECVGKSGLQKNTAWGSIEGFTSETRKYLIKTTYTHPALAKNADGMYQVRVAGTAQEYTIDKIAKAQSAIGLKENAEVSMVCKEDGSMDVDKTKTAIFDAAVASTTPEELTAEDVTIQYFAKSTIGSLSDYDKKWVPLEGEKDTLLTYPAISAGEQKIRISWDGDENYDSFTAETTIMLTDRPEAPYTPNQNPTVKLVYGDDLQVDYSGIEKTVFDAVVASSEVLTADNVTITYYATAVTGAVGDIGRNWVPLSGNKWYPAISAGEQKIRITFAGNAQYAKTVVEAEVNVTGRDPMTFTLNEAPYEVGLVFNDEQGCDYDKTAKAIYDAVVKSTSPAVDYTEMTVEYNVGTELVPVYKPLNNTDVLTKKFGEGSWSIRISWGGNKEFAPAQTVAAVTVTDNRMASAVVLKDGGSFTYNPDVSAMKQGVMDSVIDWENSTLPAKETLSIDDFTFAYEAQLSLLDGLSGDIADDVLKKLLKDQTIQKKYVPFEGEKYKLSDQLLGEYPQIGAGEHKIRVTYKGSAAYKPSQAADGTISVSKAKVKVSVKSTSMTVSEAKKNGLDLVTTNPADNFNVYVVYAGLTSNVTSALYLELPSRYTDNSLALKLIDKTLESLGQKTLTQMLRDGITVGELRDLLLNTEIIDALDKIGIDTGALGQLVKVIDKLPAIGDSIRICFGQPEHAGMYSVTAVTENKNYNTGVGIGALVLKADKARLVWNQSIGRKISAADAKTADFGATLQMGDAAAADQSSVHVLYSGFTSKWKVYSSTTTPPTEPGRYSMTVVLLGGDYQAAPITRSFQITK